MSRVVKQTMCERIGESEIEELAVQCYGNRNRSKNFLMPFTEMGMRNRNYFENGNWIEMGNLIRK